MQRDVIIIGAGHNGLTAAAYLARAGKKVLVLERREIVGGCAVTEEVDPELAPGCRVSTASYIASMLRPTIIRDLKLAAYGLEMVACDPGVQAAGLRPRTAGGGAVDFATLKAVNSIEQTVRTRRGSHAAAHTLHS